MAVDPVQLQGAPGTGRQRRDRLGQHLSLLPLDQRRIGQGFGVGAKLGRIHIALRLDPVAVAPHRAQLAAPHVEYQIVGHAEQIGAAIGYWPGAVLARLDPQFLQAVLRLLVLAAARAQEAQQFCPVAVKQCVETRGGLHGLAGIPCRQSDHAINGSPRPAAPLSEA